MFASQIGALFFVGCKPNLAKFDTVSIELRKLFDHGRSDVGAFRHYLEDAPMPPVVSIVDSLGRGSPKKISHLPSTFYRLPKTEVVLDRQIHTRGYANHLACGDRRGREARSASRIQKRGVLTRIDQLARRM